RTRSQPRSAGPSQLDLTRCPVARPLRPRSLVKYRRNTGFAAALPGLLLLTGGHASALGTEPGTKHVIEHARSGSLEADFSYFDTSQQESYTDQGRTRTYTTHVYNNFRLTMVRSGRVLFSHVVNCDSCQPGGYARGKPAPSVRLVHLDARAKSPQAIVDLYTGGAHCCFVTRFYELGRSGAHVVTRNWGDPGYVLKDLRHDGQTELVSADDRF